MSLILLAGLLSFVVADVFHSSLCAPGRLDVGGVDMVERNRGRILLAVRMGLQCHDCHKHLKEFSMMAESISDLSVAILVPNGEHPSAVRHSQLEFPRLQILHDIHAQTAQWPERHQILFDRCGRVSKTIHLTPGAPPFHDALEAVRSAVSHAQCGWCQYDTRGARDLSRKQFNAYIRNEKRSSAEQQSQRQMEYSQRSPDYGKQEPQQYRQSQQYQGYSKEPQNPQQQRQHGYSQGQPSYQYSQQAYQSPQRSQTQYHQSTQQFPDQSRYHNHQSYQRSSHQPQSQFQSDGGVQQPSYQRNYEQDQRFQYQGQLKYQQNHPQSSQRQENGGDFRIVTTATTNRPTKKHHYSEDSDYGDYLEDIVSTTQNTETQIPAPRQPNSWWPTPITSTLDYRFLLGADVPCAAYTDDICYMQQEKLGKGGQMPKCCSKGVYLTDLCIPGKCSNSTTQLCCLQKFLQAKYACCEDESQSDGNTTTNKFSQCCYSKFVTKDECCTLERADDYWSSVHELCYPNTKVDLSTVKLEVRFTEGIRVIDLGENRVWDYECKNGGNRMQLAYFP